MTDKQRQTAGMLNIALPKGRLGDKVYDMFERAGFECPSIREKNRKLIFENPDAGVRYFWVKPSDVAIYVERGAADIGVVGKDILMEDRTNVYELLDLGVGKCRMAVAGKEGFSYDRDNELRVATKFVNVAREFYAASGTDIDVIRLNGSIELAPILGLADVIVDIVETGNTLRANKLEVVEYFAPISARLISNKSSFKFLYDEITEVADGLEKIVARRAAAKAASGAEMKAAIEQAAREAKEAEAAKAAEASKVSEASKTAETGK